MKRYAPWYAAGGIAALVLVYNAWLTMPVMSALTGEDRLTVVTYREGLLNPSTIVFDLWNVKPDASMADVDRNLFKAAAALKDRNYKSVVLSYKGRGRYKLDGDQFHTIGQEWGVQNPLYVVRTMPEYISTMNGNPAFDSYSGGWLGVMTKQLEQHNELHQRWYLLAMAGQDPDGALITAPVVDY